MILGLATFAVVSTMASGLPGLLFRRRPAVAQRLSCAVLCLGAVLGLSAAVATLAGAGPSAAVLRWSAPGAALSLRLDALSAVFLLPMLAIPALCAVYGLSYWPQERLGAKAVRLQLNFGLATGSMALLVLAANAMLFLAAWEVVAVAGFLLVLTEHEKADAQRAAFLYLAAAHVGTLALFACFSLAAQDSGSFEFSRWQGLPAAGARGGWCFGLALVGFGIKAGLMPLQFWLPPAHAAAPSHVSAVMSGVLLKTGIYGLLRLTGLFGTPPAGFGAALLAAGVVSAILGVAFALGQHDLKRLLAWHSVENIGIICMGIGLALLGRARGEPALAFLGFAGAALHVVNHAVFKSLLFLGAGSVQRACGTRELDRLGGLSKVMPFTSTTFLVGAAAITGLPPLNGFVSEWLIGLGSVRALRLPAGDLAAFAGLALPALALVGALAAACFVKVHGTVFLGNARSAAARQVQEAPPTMLAPMAALAAACAVIGLLPQLWVAPLVRAAAAWTGEGEGSFATVAGDTASAAAILSMVAALLLAVVAALALVRRRLSHAPSPRPATWSCAYAEPTARMQYTGSSFADTLVAHFSWALLPRVQVTPLHETFPSGVRFHSEVPDAVLERGILPAVRLGTRLAALLRPVLLRPLIQVHVAFLLATLVVLLAWRFLG